MLYFMITLINQLKTCKIVRCETLKKAFTDSFLIGTSAQSNTLNKIRYGFHWVGLSCFPITPYPCISGFLPRFEIKVWTKDIYAPTSLNIKCLSIFISFPQQ